MKKLLYINACLRNSESRTQKIALAMLNALADRYDIDEIDLTSSPLEALNAERYQKRQAGDCDPAALSYAKKFAEADLIVAALPFWDMSFPAIFKVFCENITINGITFKSGEDGSFSGGCRAQKLILVTTRGMDIEDGSIFDQGTSYLNAIGYLWGISEIVTVSAIGMDTVEEDEREKRIADAIKKGLNIAAYL